jgi:hypothetical protein
MLLASIYSPLLISVRTESDDFLRKGTRQGTVFVAAARLKNACRLSPEQFIRFLRNPSTSEALARIVTEEKRVVRST